MKKNRKKMFLYVASVFIFLSTSCFLSTPFIDNKINSCSSKIQNLTNKYYAIRISLDMGILQWELARFFIITRHILTLQKASPIYISNNNFHYHWAIINAETLTKNASTGFRDFENPYRGKVGVVITPHRTDNQIKRQYKNNIIEANERNNKILQDIRDNMSTISSLQYYKNTCYIIGIVLNSIGLLLGIYAIKFE